jgi:hypothetical protein
MRVVTRAVNNTENSLSVPAINKIKTRCYRGHPFDEINTYPTVGGGRACRECKRISDRTMTERQLILERERNRKWREKNPDYFRMWAAAHPEEKEKRRLRYHERKIAAIQAKK